MFAFLADTRQNVVDAPANSRWITADDNYRARTLYDRVAKKTAWNTYEITL